jgi:hypothetical protein
MNDIDDIPEIDPNSWHYKLYKFNVQWIACWQGETDYHAQPYRSNLLGLCPYMRTICLWGPLTMLSNIFPLAALYFAFIAMPAGGFGVGWFIGIVVLTVAVSAGVAACIAMLAAYQYKKPAKSQLPKQAPDYKAPETFWTLVKSYLKSAKTKVCPVLRLPND